jgi:galactose-1-phosphate uridylyltransferase
MTTMNSITIDQKQLKATMSEINECSVVIHDAIVLCENNRYTEGEKVGNEPTPYCLNMLFEVVKMAANKQASLIEHLENFTGTGYCDTSSCLGMFERPKLGVPFYAVDQEAAQ